MRKTVTVFSIFMLKHPQGISNILISLKTNLDENVSMKIEES